MRSPRTGWVVPVAIGLALFAAGCQRDEALAQASPAPPAESAVDAVASAAATAASTTAPAAEPADDWVERALRASDPRFAGWLERSEELRLEILVTEVAPDGAVLSEHGYRADREYFYPASAVKPFVAVGALRRVRGLVHGPAPLAARIERCRPKRPGCEPVAEDVDDDDEKRATGDAKQEGGEKRRAVPEKKPRASEDDGDGPKKKHKKLYLGAEIHKLLAVSDNDSYNRLWDFVGQRELNEDMVALGFPNVRLHHRMDTPADVSRATPRVLLVPPGKRALEAPARTSTLELLPTPAPRLELGTAYRDGGKMVQAPMRFAQKNYASLHDLQRILHAIVFPGRPDVPALELARPELATLEKAMTALLVDGAKASAHHPFVPGVLEVVKAKRLRVEGKSGRALGFHVDNAYVEDKAAGRAFFLTATVYANPDGVLNDDVYAYEESSALLRAIGKAVASAVFAR